MFFLTTIKQISELAGFSTSTVSIVLRGAAKERSIPPDTCRKIREAAAKLNYQPNIEARSLRDQSNTGAITIAFYWAQDFRASMMIRFMAGLNNRLAELGEAVKLIVVPYNPGELENDARLSKQSYYHAAIICNADNKDMAFLNSNKLSIPLVLYNRRSPLYDHVYIENEKLGRLAAGVFVKHGKKHPAILNAPIAFMGMKLRCDGFIAAWEKLGISVSNQFTNNNNCQSGYDGMKKLLKAKTRPDCLFCASDMVAIGALRCLHQNNVKVPEDMEIISVGNGDIQLDEYAWPSIATVLIPMEEMAGKCISLLLERIKKPYAPLRAVKNKIKFIPRESCGK